MCETATLEHGWGHRLLEETFLPEEDILPIPAPAETSEAPVAKSIPGRTAAEEAEAAAAKIRQAYNFTGGE